MSNTLKKMKIHILNPIICAGIYEDKSIYDTLMCGAGVKNSQLAAVMNLNYFIIFKVFLV